MGEENKEKINKAVLANKLNKYGATKKTMYSLLGMTVCMMLIIVLSITQAGFDINAIKTMAFWIEFIILTGLCIYGMLSGQQTGDDVARNNPNGAFRASLKKFTQVFNLIDGLMLFAFFDGWLDFYRDRKIQKKTEAILKDNGIHQMEVLKLDLSELDNLTSPFKKEWEDGSITYFLTYTLEQIDVIKFCLSGKVKVSKLPRTFFVNAFYNSEKDMWESAAKSNKKKTAYLGTSYVFRIASLLVISIISAGLIPGNMEGAGQAAVWLSLAKRVFCIITAFIWGIFIGFEVVKIDMSYMDFKTDVLNQYYQEYKLGVYKPDSLEEKAKKDYEEAELNGENEQEDVLE